MINKTKLLLDIWSGIDVFMPQPSNDEVDIIIPVVPKDLEILPLCLEGIKHCVKNKIKGIYLVSPKDQRIIDFCKRSGLIFIDESSVLGISPNDINLLVNTPTGVINRSGWLFQQLLKLSANIGTCEHFLCIDADHILLQEHTFLTSCNKTVFYLSDEKNPPYHTNRMRLLKSDHIGRMPFSYVAHKMLFSKKQLRELQRKIEKANGKGWIESILDSYDCNEVSGFSEFELYGNFVTRKILKPWKQLELDYGKLASYEQLVALYGRIYRSVTFPEWKNHNK